jgi:hypothetical protein
MFRMGRSATVTTKQAGAPTSKAMKPVATAPGPGPAAMWRSED